MGPQGKEGMSYRFGERTHSRIECARSNSWGLNAETKKCRHRARRRSFSLDILSYRTFPQLRRRVVLLERKRTQKTKKPKAVYTKVLTPPGFQELVSDWHADHVYKHDPRAIEAFTLVAFLAYILFRVFLICNIKPQLRCPKTESFWAALITAQIYS